MGPRNLTYGIVFGLAEVMQDKCERISLRLRTRLDWNDYDIFEFWIDGFHYSAFFKSEDRYLRIGPPFIRDDIIEKCNAIQERCNAVIDKLRERKPIFKYHDDYSNINAMIENHHNPTEGGKTKSGGLLYAQFIYTKNSLEIYKTDLHIHDDTKPRSMFSLKTTAIPRIITMEKFLKTFNENLKSKGLEPFTEKELKDRVKKKAIKETEKGATVEIDPILPSIHIKTSTKDTYSFHLDEAIRILGEIPDGIDRDEWLLFYFSQKGCDKTENL